ncbi:MAG: DUF2510 domain-containing protein [Rhodoglobus sp.]
MSNIEPTNPDPTSPDPTSPDPDEPVSAGSSTPPANWYPDPDAPTERLRWWDGTAWTENRHPIAVAGAQPARVLGPRTIQITLAGVSLILAGASRLSGYGNSSRGSDLLAEVIGAAILEGLAMAAAFLFFLLAGYPNRKQVTRVVSSVMIGVYLISTIVGVAALTIPGVSVVAGIAGLLVLVGGVVFGILAATTRELPGAFRALPLVLYAGILVGGLVFYSLSAVAIIVVGILYITLGRRVTPALSAFRAPANATVAVGENPPE